MKRLVVERAADGAQLWTVEVANSWRARLRGLIGHAPLGERDGLYLPGTNSIHMLFMGFAIDCVFVGATRADGSREVLAVKADLRPWTGVVWWVRGARGALELTAGAAAGAGVRRGDLLRLAPAA